MTENVFYHFLKSTFYRLTYTVKAITAILYMANVVIFQKNVQSKLHLKLHLFGDLLAARI